MGVAGPIRIGDSLVLFTGQLYAGDFFQGIEPSQTKYGRRFSKSSKTVTEFPSSLTVHLDTRIVDSVRRIPQTGDVAKSLLSHFRLSAKWKTGLALRDVKKIDWNFYRPSTEEWMQREDSKELSNLGLRVPDPVNQGLWIIEIRIEDEHVPLTDSLVIVVESEERLVARLSARL